QPVNDPPQAQNDSAATNEDEAVTVDALNNDSDVDDDTLKLQSASQPAHGTVVVNGGESVSYTPLSGYTGSDSFSYIISDGELTSTATINLTVRAINHAPQAAEDTATTEQATAVTIAVLSNDQDPDGDSLALGNVTQPAHGEIHKNGDNS